MDTNRLLTWFTILGVFANVLALFVVRRRPGGWQLAPFVAVYMFLGAAILYAPQEAGIVGFAAFVICVMLPGLWLQFVNSLLVRRKYRAAAVAAFWLRPVILALERPAPLTERQQARLFELQTSLQLQRAQLHGTRKVRATPLLIAANIAVFAAEIPGGVEDEENLRRLGALVIPWHGEPWQLLASCFLHFGVLHITMNMLGLMLFGRRVEQRLGTARAAATYLMSGVLGMMLYAMLGNFVQVSRTVVGASGCVMGMVGAMFAISYIDWRRQRMFAGRQLALLGIIVGTQVIFDLMTPEIAMSVHMAGLVIGAALAWYLYETP